MSFGEKVKESWDQTYVSPPIAHMEEYSLLRLSEDFPETGIESILKTLADSNIIVRSAEISLKDLAKENEITPSRIYEIITSVYRQNPASVSSQAPAGVGKLTVQNVAERLGQEPSELIKILKDNGIDADEGTTMRTISEQTGISPHDLYSLLGGR
jgi:lambda repressor-like predicted transcriptional regulator